MFLDFKHVLPIKKKSSYVKQPQDTKSAKSYHFDEASKKSSCQNTIKSAPAKKNSEK